MTTTDTRCLTCGLSRYEHVDHRHVADCPFGDCGSFVPAPTTEQRTADDINRSIAELMGWRYVPDPEGGVRSAHWQHRGGMWRDFVPDYCHDLNALRDGPEAKLREAKLMCQSSWDGAWFSVEWWHYGAPLRAQQTDTEAMARALAAEAALKAMKALNDE